MDAGNAAGERPGAFHNHQSRRPGADRARDRLRRQRSAQPEIERQLDRNFTKPAAGPLGTILALIAFVAIPLAAGWIGSLATTPNIPTWYAGLAKPSFNPPNEVFPVVWTILYVLMGIAAWLVWRAPVEENRRRLALAAWLGQLIINVLWSLAFFGARSPLAGLIVIVVLLAAIVGTILAFRRVSGWAAMLLVPYLAWVAFATILNAAILSLNG